MPILYLDHVQLAMPEGREADARAFYAGVLGIPEVAKPEHLRPRGGCWFEDGPVKIHLGIDPDFKPSTKAHPAFIVADVKALATRIGRSGYLVVTDEPLQGYERLYACDPFGNRIEFMQVIV